MKFIFIILIFCLWIGDSSNIVYSPVISGSEDSTQDIILTKIGDFGILRKPRPGIPAHYHTGIDIMRPSDNYENEFIFPITEGIVISKRTDGPYANLILEHEYEGKKFWSLYEHVAGIMVDCDDQANPHAPVARFMNRTELDRYGWQFNHFHLEILKTKPVAREPSDRHPQLRFRSYTLVCYTRDDLKQYYYDPVEFLQTFPEILQKKENGSDEK